MENLQITDIEPCYEHAVVLSSVWSRTWPQIAINSGYSIEEILKRLEHRSISWWIKAIEKMKLGFYIKDLTTGATGICYVMNDSDFLVLENQKVTDELRSKCDIYPNVYSFLEKETWGSELSKVLGKKLIQKSINAGIEKLGGWVMKTNKRSSAAAKKGNWILLHEIGNPIWEPNINFEYWIFDNNSYLKKFENHDNN